MFLQANLLPKDHILYTICKELFEKTRVGENLFKIVINLNEENSNGYDVFVVSRLKMTTLTGIFMIPVDFEEITKTIYDKITLEDLKKLPKYHSAWEKLTIMKQYDYVYEFTANETILVYN